MTWAMRTTGEATSRGAGVSLIGVDYLVEPDVLVEVEATAILD